MILSSVAHCPQEGSAIIFQLNHKLGSKMLISSESCQAQL